MKGWASPVIEMGPWPKRHVNLKRNIKKTVSFLVGLFGIFLFFYISYLWSTVETPQQKYEKMSLNDKLTVWQQMAQEKQNAR